MDNENEKKEREIQPEVVEEEIVTFEDLAREMEENQKTAEQLFGAQDPSICTFPEGYKPRQTLFTCLTCTPEPQMAGICYGCSLNCHAGHDIVELYTKRKFRCDCGNSKFPGKPCGLYEEKDDTNQYNQYNQNFHGKFCTCHVFYPTDTEGHELLQCELCEDWFHDHHVTIKKIATEDHPTSSEGAAQEDSESHSSLVCSSCIKKIPFVQRIPTGNGAFCHSKLTEEHLVIDDEAISLEIEKFRERLCKCSDCNRVYERAGCDFLMDDEDDIGAFEKESLEKAKHWQEPTEQQEMHEMVREYGMEGTQYIYSEFNQLKRKMGEFLKISEANGKTVSAADVKTFFANLEEDRIERKRARLEGNNSEN